MSNAHFKIKQASDGQYLFNLIASNGEVILTGERYVHRSGALNGIESVKLNAPIDERYERRQASNGQPYFVLRASNYEIIGSSEMYSSVATRDAGISAVKESAMGAGFVDGNAG